MEPDRQFRKQPPEFWALVKLVSQLLRYSLPKTRSKSSGIKRYGPDAIAEVLSKRGLKVDSMLDEIGLVAAYSNARADLLEDIVEPNLMNREQAAALFQEVRMRVRPPERLLSMNKQKGDKRHYAYLAGIVNMLTHETLMERFGQAPFDPSPRGPLTFAGHGKPLRTLFRWMDGAYPNVNHPSAAWEIKEYYGTTTFGSRVADGVYVTALDGYELNDLRDVGVQVDHYLFCDDRFTWWDCGKSYLCRIVDMLHAGLLDGAFFGRETVTAWPAIVEAWPEPRSPSEE